jgi:hypothetical protein
VLWLTILYEKEFKNPQKISTDHHVSLFPEHSTLVIASGGFFAT